MNLFVNEEPIDSYTALLPANKDGKVSIQTHNIMPENRPSVIKNLPLEFQDPVDAIIMQQIMNDPMKMLFWLTWTPAKQAEVKAKMREQLFAPTEAATKLRKQLGIGDTPNVDHTVEQPQPESL